MELRPHQKRFLDANPGKAVLFWSMRAGKSLAAKLWSESRKNVVVVCKKSNKREWIGLCPHALVFTKEEFKKQWDLISVCGAIVVDELHHHLAPLFVPKDRSAQAEALYKFIKKHNPDFLGLTGTPLTNKPASLHTLLTYIGKYISWKEEFQPRFYSLESRPFLPRPAWMPRSGWRQLAEQELEKYTDKVTLQEIAPYLPPEIIEKVKVKPGIYQYAEDEDYNWQKDHRAEQYNKGNAIREIGENYRKVIVVCKYTEQINELAKLLKRDKPVYVLNGQTKNQEQTIKDAQNDPDCFLIVQASIGEGWSGYMFDAMIFASIGHRFIDKHQMYSRLFDIDHQKPRIYYYLLAGQWDKAIYKYVVEEEKNFTPPD